MSIDFDKPVQTRDGREVRIYTQQGRHPTRVVVGEICVGDVPTVDRWYANGSYFNDGGLADSDLVNVGQFLIGICNFSDSGILQMKIDQLRHQ